MALLFGGGGKKPEEPKALVHVQLQTSAYGEPVAIVYGTTRITGNLIWLDEFTSHKQTQTQGKGGDVTTTSFTYSACVILALCEGPITGILNIWADKDTLWNTLTAPELAMGAGFDVLDVGQRTNTTPWTHLTSVHPAKAIAYAGTAWVAAAEKNLPNGSMRNWSFEVRGLQSLYADAYISEIAHAVTAYDAHPADVISDLLTSVDYGLGWSSTRILMNVGQDGTAPSSFVNYAHAMTFYSSPSLDQQRSALELLTEFLDATNSAAVWSQGKLKFIPYGDTAQTANGYTFTPYLTARYALTTDDLLGDSDPIEISRMSEQDTFNSFPVEYLNRTQSYKESIAEDPEQSDIEASGLRRASTVSAHMICRTDYALAISRIMAQRAVFQRNTYKFKLPLRYILLEPMDIVTLTDPLIGLVDKTVRLIEIQEDEEGSLSCVAEDVATGASTGVAYTSQAGDGTGSATTRSADPGDANPPVIFIPTLQTTTGFLEVWLATNGGSDWGGAQVWLSDDGTTYAQAGTANPATYGTTTSSLSSGATTIPVQLVANSGELVSTSADGALDDLTAMWLDGEVFSYETATLTGTNAYSLTGVLRGRQATTAAAHSSGVDVVRLNDNVFKMPIAYARLGKTIYVKLVSFNKTNDGLQDISLLSPYTFNVPAAPDLLPAPSAVTITIQTTEFP